MLSWTAAVRWPTSSLTERSAKTGCCVCHRAPATPVGGPGAVRANQGCQVRGVSSDTLVRLASGLDARCVKKQLASGLDARCVKNQCGLVGLCTGGRMTFNLRLPSPYGSCRDETR